MEDIKSMEKTVYSRSGREYTITQNNSMAACIVMDCMTPEALDEEYENKSIDFNFVACLLGEVDEMEDEIFYDILDKYEETLIVKGFEHETGKPFSIYKGL